jgi:hypothetical protein
MSGVTAQRRARRENSVVTSPGNRAASLAGWAPPSARLRCWRLQGTRAGWEHGSHGNLDAGYFGLERSQALPAAQDAHLSEGSALPRAMLRLEAKVLANSIHREYYGSTHVLEVVGHLSAKIYL